MRINPDYVETKEDQIQEENWMRDYPDDKDMIKIINKGK